MIYFKQITIALLTGLIFFSSCQSPTLEQQVEKLMKTENAQKRTKIAFVLADSLNPRAVDLISGLHGENPYANQALDDMLTHYKEKIENTRAFECIGSIPTSDAATYLGEQTVTSLQGEYVFNIVKKLPTTLKLQALLAGLRISENEKVRQRWLIEELKSSDSDAMVHLIDEWYVDKNEGILGAIASYNGEAIRYLIQQLGKSTDAEDLLAKIGQPAVSALMSKMKSSEQDVKFSAADALVKMKQYNPGAVSDLMSAFDNSNIGAIARNYPFYIRMGLSGTEALLLNALRTNFSESMCVDYLNCGNSEIETGAREIASSFGYVVYPGAGRNNGPKWGSGNKSE